LIALHQSNQLHLAIEVIANKQSNVIANKQSNVIANKQSNVIANWQLKANKNDIRMNLPRGE
jgi:hypothetical protein